MADYFHSKFFYTGIMLASSKLLVLYVYGFNKLADWDFRAFLYWMQVCFVVILKLEYKTQIFS